ncbi:hypothetical protein WMF38_07550 [Sorangium sp. So ce118]
MQRCLSNPQRHDLAVAKGPLQPWQQHLVRALLVRKPAAKQVVSPDLPVDFEQRTVGDAIAMYPAGELGFDAQSVLDMVPLIFVEVQSTHDLVFLPHAPQEPRLPLSASRGSAHAGPGIAP